MLADWRDDLKPPVHNPPPHKSIIPRKRGQLSEDPPSATGLPSPQASIAMASRIAPILSAPEPPSPIIFALKTPRPDITLGLSDDSLAGAIGSSLLLPDMQENGELVSDPHGTQIGLRFPFFVIESKSGATGANLWQAQNQAAVSAAIALRILRQLDVLVEIQNDGLHDEEEGTETTRDLRGTVVHGQSLYNRVFSMVHEGPVFELWAHYETHHGVKDQEEDRYDVHASCVATYRITIPSDAQRLMRHFACILHWANGEFLSGVIAKLKQHEGARES